MTLTVKHTQDALSIVLAGRLDSTTAGDLDSCLTQELTPEVTELTIDLTDVDFISSRGLRVLVSAYQLLNGRPMKLKGPNASILEVLRLSGLLKIFTVL